MDVVVIAEAPTLAASLAALFESEGLGVHVVPSLEEAARDPSAKGSPRSVLVSACHGCVSRNARAWLGGLLGERPRVAVGGRDATLRASERLHIVPLPLEPTELEGLVRRLTLRPPGEVGGADFKYETKITVVDCRGYPRKVRTC